MFKFAKLRKEMGSLGIEPILGCVLPGTSLKALISFTISTTVKMSVFPPFVLWWLSSEMVYLVKIFNYGVHIITCPAESLGNLERKICTLPIHQIFCVLMTLCSIAWSIGMFLPNPPLTLTVRFQRRECASRGVSNECSWACSLAAAKAYFVLPATLNKSIINFQRYSTLAPSPSLTASWKSLKRRPVLTMLCE